MQKLTNDLEVLAGLRERGDLTADEFARAKAALLGSVSPAVSAHAAVSAAHMETLTRQNEAALLDQQWAIEREKFALMGKYGARYIPTSETAVVTGIGVALLGAFGIFFSISAGSVIAGACVVLITAVGAIYTLGIRRMARRYRQAQTRYEKRRAALLSERVQ